MMECNELQQVGLLAVGLAVGFALGALFATFMNWGHDKQQQLINTRTDDDGTV